MNGLMLTSSEETDAVRRQRPSAGSVSERQPVHSLSLLCVAAQEPAWTNLTLQLDAHGCHEARFRWVATVRELLEALREESHDCLLVADDQAAGSFDALEAVNAVRAAGYDDPIVLLAQSATDELWLRATELQCTVLTSPGSWESRALVPMILTEVRRSELQRDNYRLTLAQHRRLLRERDETEYLLDQQRQILQELHGLVEQCDTDDAAAAATSGDPPGTTPDVVSSEEVCRFYDELLRTHVMMGSGRLSSEITRLVELFATARVSPRDALGMHLQRVEKLVRGLGSRSSRHVLSRADLLALELIIQLGECYRGIEPRP